AALDGAVGGDASGVDTAVDDWAADPTADRFVDVRRTTASLGGRLADARAAADRRADWIFAALLAVASVGWFLWFRPVVRRQHRLSRRLTQAELAMAGEQRLTALVRSSADLVVVVDPDTKVSFASPSTQRVLGREAASLVGRPLTALVEPADTPV